MKTLLVLIHTIRKWVYDPTRFIFVWVKGERVLLP